MTIIEAVEVLRIIPAGTGTARERAIDVAIAELLARPTAPTAKPRKTAKPKVNRHVAAFQKIKFPVGVAAMRPIEAWPHLSHCWPDDREVPAEVRAQFLYGSTKRVGPDAAVLYAAKV